VIEAIQAQLQALASPVNRVKVVLRVRDAVPLLAGARYVVALEKLTARLEKVTREFLEALNETPPLPGIEDPDPGGDELEEAVADSEGGEA